MSAHSCSDSFNARIEGDHLLQSQNPVAARVVDVLVSDIMPIKEHPLLHDLDLLDQ